MKKLVLLLILAMGWSLGTQAQTAIAIYGYVTELGSGNAIPNHTVHIVSDSLGTPGGIFYVSSKQTGSTGFYIDTIAIPSGVALRFHVLTYDCQNQIHLDTVDVFANGTYTGNPANFSICRVTQPVCQTSFTATPDSSGYVYNFLGISNSTVASWTWSFGDGTSGSGQLPTHTYTTNGVYVVCLTAVDTFNCVSTFCDSILVSGGSSSNCSVNFQAYPDSTNPSTVFFTGTATNAMNPSWSWTFGDGGTSTAQNPVHSYNNLGWYQVCVTISGANGCVDTFCDSVYAGSASVPCQASYSYTANGLTATFYGVANANVSTWSWNLGSGYVSGGSSATTTFAQAGTYPVCLAITTTLGCTDTFCNQVIVYPPSYSIWGQVSTNNMPADFGTVWLITYDSTSNLLSSVDSTTMDSAGHYYFSQIAPGSYTVKAALDSSSAVYANYLPTYLGDSLFWSSATFLNVNGNLGSQDIHMVAGTNPGGPGFIGGNVLQGANKQDPGDPIGNMPILLLDMNDQAIAYTYSDANGDYSFSNLAYGTYKVYAEALNRSTDPAIVTLSAANSSVSDVNLEVGSMTVTTTAIDPDKFQFFDGSLRTYPNPASNQVWLQVELKQPTQLQVVLRNTLGQVIRQQEQAAGQGETEISLDLSGIPAGVYLIQVSAGQGEVVTTKLLKY